MHLCTAFFVMKNIFKDNKKNYIYGGLYGSSGSYIIEKISSNFNTTIILLNNNNEIINFSNELKLFLHNDKNICLFLEIESFPYEDLIYDVNILSERLKTYKNILSHDNNIIITSYSALAKYLVPKNILSKYFTKISKNFDYNSFITLLREMKYDRTEKVLNKGEYAIRGAIIDIYSTVEDKPIRLNFDGDKLEALKMFNLDTQASIDTIESFFLGPANEVIITDEVIKNYETITLEKAYEIHNNNPFIHTFNIEGEIEYFKKYDDNFSILSYWNAWEPEKVFFESMLYSGKLLEIKNKKIRKEIESIYTKQQERVSGMTDITKNNSNKIGNWFELTRDKYSFDTTNKSIFQNDKDQKLKNMLITRRGILKSRIVDTENYLQGLQNIVLLISSEYKKLD